MTNSDRALYILGFLILFTIISFVNGAAFLDEDLIKGLPAGNVLVMAALISCGVIGRILTWNYQKLHRLNTIAVVFGAMWYPLGILLSGSTRLNFVNDGQDSFVFEVLTAVIIIVCFGMMLFSIGYKLNSIIRRKLKKS